MYFKVVDGLVLSHCSQLIVDTDFTFVITSDSRGAFHRLLFSFLFIVVVIDYDRGLDIDLCLVLNHSS